MRLLVVEDDAKLARVLAQTPRQEGYHVDLARAGDDALEQATGSDYDALVRAVSISTGMRRSRLRSERQTVKPSSPGSITSSTSAS